MEPIYDRNGKTVGWLKANIIYDTAGIPRAFLRKGAIFNYDGEYLGRLVRGYFRDKNGDAVAFLHGAEGGPVIPVHEAPPIPPIFAIPPVSPVTPMPPLAPISSLNWSDLNWEEFLRGEKP